MNNREAQNGQAQLPQFEFSAMFAALAQAEAFSLFAADYTPITTVQTHASAVILTPQYVYKLKKPKNFGFFDYSTPALRRHFCIQETLVNQPLAASVYLGVAPILLRANGHLLFGPTFPPDSVPLPETLLTVALGDEVARVIDYAVVMVRLAHEATLERRVYSHAATPVQLADVAQVVAQFHASRASSEQNAHFGSLTVIRANWVENFAQMQPYIGRTLDEQTYTQLMTYTHAFMDGYRRLFESRVREGHIRDCHGDLRLQHVYLLDQKIVILDAIEFNERFRYGDVAGEIAFLAMELEAAQRHDLARAFVASYITTTNDAALCELLPFYLCYRACVRGKVASFQLDEQEIPHAQREQAKQVANALFTLAARFASGPTRPQLLLIGGLMGTGKSTLAQALHEATGYALLSSDATRKQLAQIEASQPLPELFGQGLYSTDWSARTYQMLRATASQLLHAGHSVIVDASHMRRADRLSFADIAQEEHTQATFLECSCSSQTAQARLARRWQQRIEAASRQEGLTQASDGRPALYQDQKQRWEAFQAEQEPSIRYLSIDTEQEAVSTRQRALDALGLSFLC